MKKSFLLLSLLFWVFMSLSATEQIRDKFISSGGEIYDIYGNYPLAGFFRENPERRPVTDLASTALWRGYIAYFQMSQDRLYLVDVRIPDGGWNSTKSVLANVFPGGSKVLAYWFSGHVAFPLPKEEGKTDSRYLEYTMEAGEVSDKKIVSHYHDVIINTGRPAAGMGVREYDFQSSFTDIKSSYHSFESMAEIRNGVLLLMEYSPDAEGLVTSFPLMIVDEGHHFHTLSSLEHKGILLKSDLLLYVYVDNTDSPIYHGCSSGTSPQCMEGIYDIPFADFPWKGNTRIFSVEPTYMREIIFSSGALSIDNPEDYYKYSRPRNIRITNHSISEVIEIELKDTAHPQRIDLGKEGRFEISIEVLSVYEGNESQDIGINFIKAKGW